MSQEVEMKLALGQQGPETLRQHPLLTHLPSSRDQLTNTYFDTARGDLKQARMALRLRRTGNGWVQTLKTSGTGSGGMSQRGEWEWPVPEAQLDLAGLAELPPINDLPNEVLEHLEARFTTDFHRQTWLLSVEQNQVELALDEGEIRAGGRHVGIRELELELKHGSAQCLPELAEQLVSQVALRPSDTSKAARGAALLANAWPALEAGSASVVLHNINMALDAFSDTGERQWINRAIDCLERLGHMQPELQEDTATLIVLLRNSNKYDWLTPQLGSMLLRLARQLPDHIEMA
ncbi:CYTH domain-containing protein [Halomonas huangheensis]|uniref:CYTH domain-containing protein n=1 Tax=Halomonas huangheensis TaxID=1178482 RepID=W1N333_9GAMM|nr:CYTH domain-containing protein [Halomonas huangheensis]ALM51442.1 hypothetical protein AR456_03390 [Halomonas huangheensis]ERL49894.1 hypothetical protein BJB45_01875 [Halomonas huangheensis]